jgi:hypothetical protein
MATLSIRATQRKRIFKNLARTDRLAKAVVGEDRPLLRTQSCLENKAGIMPFYDTSGSTLGIAEVNYFSIHWIYETSCRDERRG